MCQCQILFYNIENVRAFEILKLKNNLLLMGDSNIVHLYPMLQQIVGYSFLENCIIPGLVHALNVVVASIFCLNLAVAKMKHKPLITTENFHQFL
jgi:hypothetical protein